MAAALSANGWGSRAYAIACVLLSPFAPSAGRRTESTLKPFTLSAGWRPASTSRPFALSAGRRPESKGTPGDQVDARMRFDSAADGRCAQRERLGIACVRHRVRAPLAVRPERRPEAGVDLEAVHPERRLETGVDLKAVRPERRPKAGVEGHAGRPGRRAYALRLRGRWPLRSARTVGDRVRTPSRACSSRRSPRAQAGGRSRP